MSKEKKEKKHKKKKTEKKHKKEKHKKSDSRKRARSPSSDSDSGSSSGLSTAANVPAAPVKVTPPSFADLYPMPRRRTGSIASAGPIASLPASAAELQRRNERAERFVASAADVALAAARAAAPTHHAATSGGVLEGQSAMLEKSYTRLTALPNAADVRPLPVLRQAFELVGRKWRAERDYTYACDMLKAIRQDLTVQHLAQPGGDSSRTAFAIQVYEAHAIIALESDDLGEFGACQAALVPLHAVRKSARAAEFGAYRLLHAATLRGASLGAELDGILSALRDEDSAHAAVQQALRVGVALNRDDIVSVLAELPHLLFHGACLLKAQLPRLRERALHALCRAYLPALPLTLLARRLGWADDTRSCEKFLRSVGTVPSRASGSSEAQLDTKAALHTLAERAAAARAEAEREELAEQARLRGHGRHIPLAEWQVGPAVPHEFLGGMDW